jgi:hypothetical protein
MDVLVSAQLSAVDWEAVISEKAEVISLEPFESSRPYISSGMLLIFD